MSARGSAVPAVLSPRRGAASFPARFAVLAALILGSVVACDEGSPTQPGPQPTPTPIPLSIAYASDYDGSPESVAVEIAEPSPSDAAVGLVVEVRAHELPTVDGVFFDLVYPPDRLVFRGFYTDNDVLIYAGSIGQPNREPGRLRCFFSNYGFPHYPVYGSGWLMRIYFDPVGEGTGEIEFEGYGLIQAETGNLRYGKLNWFGGSVTVHR
ncbi:MAG: hypothetical protein KDB94_03990 [Acidobacteria bacterium]|nr:hypothetical protein [Acidobacteriota bacterium]